MGIQVNFELIQDAPVVGANPIPFTIALPYTSGDFLNRYKTVENDEFHTLEVGEMEGPYRFFLMNIHATINVKIGFGQSTPIILEPTEWTFWPGEDIPYASGDGAQSRLFYKVMNKT